MFFWRADFLGHSSVETTRIYLLPSGMKRHRMLALQSPLFTFSYFIVAIKWAVLYNK